MFYKLLGCLVWNGGKVFLRTRYGSAVRAQVRSLAGAVVVAGGLALAVLAVEAQRIRRLARRPPPGLERLAAVAESSAVPSLPGLAVTAVEWLPSGAESGLVRVRGRWTEEHAREPDLPVLTLRRAAQSTGSTRCPTPASPVSPTRGAAPTWCPPSWWRPIPRRCGWSGRAARARACRR